MLADDVELGHHVILEGRVELAAGVRIGHGVVLGGVPQDLKFKASTPSGVRVGAGSVLREYVTVHRATTAEGWTEIGRDCLVMGLAHVAHDCRLGDGVIVINYAGITGHCQIGDRATIGGYGRHGAVHARGNRRLHRRHGQGERRRAAVHDRRRPAGHRPRA